LLSELDDCVTVFHRTKVFWTRATASCWS